MIACGRKWVAHLPDVLMFSDHTSILLEELLLVLMWNEYYSR
jgi:hypothetical protein